MDQIERGGKVVGSQQLLIAANGDFKVSRTLDGETARFVCRNKQLHKIEAEGTKELSLVEYKLCPEAIQATAIAAANGWLDLGMFGELRLDGSDKAGAQRAYRMKCLDEDDDSFYFWLSVFDQHGNDNIRLLKAGADIDCKHDYGGIVFSRLVGPIGGSRTWGTKDGRWASRANQAGLFETIKRAGIH